MKAPLALAVALLALGGCASTIPPAPVTAPVGVALPDPIPAAPPAPEPHSVEEQVADAAVLNGLAAAVPDSAVVPAFDATGVTWDIDVRRYADHPRVRYYMDYFQGSGRERMGVFLSRGARFDGMIRRRLEAEGLPGDLGYLALIESGYSSDAVSRAYAVGMWQFMKGTARGYGLRVDSWVDERRDPIRATDAAARHLRDLRARFGSLYLAAAAYNAGAGKVSRSLGKLEWDAPADSAPAGEPDSAAADSVAVDSAAADSLAEVGDAGGAEPTADGAAEAVGIASDAAFFRLAEGDLLAAETQDYVPKLIAAALIAKQPERYGFPAPAADPFAYDSLVVSDATGLDVVARLAGTSVRVIRDLNPQYLRLATPPRTRSVIRLPVGSGEEVAARYSALPRSGRVRFLTHVVRRRERLGSIATRYRVPAAEIRAMNPRAATALPRAGARLTIPAVAVPSALAVKATGTRVAPGERRLAKAVVYRVRRGDTLGGIARRYRVSVKALRRANALPASYALRAGMRLRIPG